MRATVVLVIKALAAVPTEPRGYCCTLHAHTHFFSFVSEHLIAHCCHMSWLTGLVHGPLVGAGDGLGLALWHEGNRDAVDTVAFIQRVAEALVAEHVAEVPAQMHRSIINIQHEVYHVRPGVLTKT